MKQIAAGIYECPSCKVGRLDIHTQTPVNEKDFRITFICQGCQEAFFSIEEAHLSPEDRCPEFVCLYCKKQCDYLSFKDDWTDYWRCKECKAYYDHPYNKDNLGLQYIHLYSRINGKLYVLHQNLWQENSRIDMIPDDPEDTVIMVKGFDMLLPQIKPDNIEKKLRTILLFQ